ncbi:hypothetical protein IKW72_04120 [bacterium]|nr:hypothetical protein [bacterium]
MKKLSAFVFTLLLASLTFGMGVIPAMTPAPQSTDSNYWWCAKHYGKLNEIKERGDALVAFYGDSITELWEWQDRGKAIWEEQFVKGPYKGICFGYSADCTQHLMWRLDNGEMDGIDPKVVVLQIGTNNSWLHPEYPAADTILAISAILQQIRNKFSDAKIILCPIPPCGELPDDPRRIKNAVVNKEIQKMTDGRDIVWLDWSHPLLKPDGKVDQTLFYDFVHPTKEGYEKWFQALKPLLDEFLVPRKEPEAVTPESKLNEEWWRKRLFEHRVNICANTNKYFNLVLCGDSITHNWEGWGKSVFEEYFSNYKTLNLGYGGDKTQHLLWRLQNGELDGYKAKLVAVMIGTNNVEDPAEDVAAGIKASLDVIREKQPEAKILLMPIFPRDKQPTNERRVKNEKVNEMIKNYADGEKIIWLDFNKQLMQEDGTLSEEVFPDLLHPNEKGYRVWAEAIKPFLENNK